MYCEEWNGWRSPLIAASPSPWSAVIRASQLREVVADAGALQVSLARTGADGLVMERSPVAIAVYDLSARCNQDVTSVRRVAAVEATSGQTPSCVYGLSDIGINTSNIPRTRHYPDMNDVTKSGGLPGTPRWKLKELWFTQGSRWMGETGNAPRRLLHTCSRDFTLQIPISVESPCFSLDSKTFT